MNTQRDITPDVLRGFALLGILVVNIQFMGLSSAEGARGEWALGLVNGSATFIIASVFTGKFYRCERKMVLVIIRRFHKQK